MPLKRMIDADKISADHFFSANLRPPLSAIDPKHIAGLGENQ
jgi:hypothetical protein